MSEDSTVKAAQPKDETEPKAGEPKKGKGKGKREKKEKKPAAEKKFIPKYNTFCWYELTTNDVEGAKTFYNGLFNWAGHEAKNSPMPYTMFQFKEQEFAGVMDSKHIPGGCPSNWTPHLHSKELEKSVESVKKNKGTVCKEATEVGEHGRFAICADPQGATFAFWQLKGKHTPTKDNDKKVTKPPCPVVWHELVTSDTEAAVKFYKSAVAWGVVDHNGKTPTNEDYTYHMFCLKGERDSKKCFGGVAKTEGDAKPHWLLYVEVANADEVVANCTKLGGRVIKAAFDAPNVGRMATLADPQGAVFAIIQSFPKTEEPAKRPQRAKGKKAEKAKEEEEDTEMETEKEEKQEEKKEKPKKEKKQKPKKEAKEKNEKPKKEPKAKAAPKKGKGSKRKAADSVDKDEAEGEKKEGEGEKKEDKPAAAEDKDKDKKDSDGDKAMEDKDKKEGDAAESDKKAEKEEEGEKKKGRTRGKKAKTS